MIYNFSSRFRILKGGKISLVVSAVFSSLTLCLASPKGGTVTSGTASITQNKTITNINQTSNKATINWQNFSIAANETVNFNQPNSSAITLNRVIGNEKSIINGALNANGQVWILNSNGVLFGKNASINTSGILATTAELSDKDFNAKNYSFKNATANSIINQGTIEVINNGSVILASNETINEGTIKAIKGNVHLVGTDSYSINLNGNSLVNLRVNKGVLDAMVSNKGTIKANGGKIYLTTNAVNELLKGVVNNTGIIEANSIDDLTGNIELFAHGGETNIDGKITANNGFIETSGSHINFSDTLDINAGNGGTWLIDPNNIKIVSDAIAEANVDYLGAPLYSSLDDSTILRASTIETQLNNGTSVIVETSEAGTNSQAGDIFLQTSINKTSGADATLTLKAHRNILFADSYNLNSIGSILSTTNKLNVVLWSDSDGNNNGSVWLPQNSNISTNGGHIHIAGGASSKTWNGLTVGNSYAVGSSFSSKEGNSIARGSSINGNISANGLTSGGDIFIKGLASQSNYYTSARGVSLSGSVTTNHGGNITIEGKAKGASDAVAIGDKASSLTDGSAIVRVENGTILINGYGNTANANSNSFELNNGSYIDDNATGLGTLIINANTDEIFADSTSYIKINKLLLKNGFTTTLTNANNNIGVLAATNMANLTYKDKNTITIGSINGVNGITANGDINLSASSIVISEPVSNGSNILTLDASGTIYDNLNGYINTNNLLLKNGRIILDNIKNDTSVIAANNLTSLSYIDANELTIGKINSTNGITALGAINISTNTGNLTINNNINTSDIGTSAIVLNAGKSQVAGIATGGDIKYISGNISMSNTSRATFYTGSINGSSINTLISNGNFRYNSDESSNGYDTVNSSLNSGLYTLYREQPTIYVTANNDSFKYNGSSYIGGNGVTYSGFVNNDTSSILNGKLVYTGTSQGASKAGIYTISANGLSNNLGYDITFINGQLEIKEDNTKANVIIEDKIIPKNNQVSKVKITTNNNSLMPLNSIKNLSIKDLDENQTKQTLDLVTSSKNLQEKKTNKTTTINKTKQNKKIDNLIENKTKNQVKEKTKTINTIKDTKISNLNKKQTKNEQTEQTEQSSNSTKNSDEKTIKKNPKTNTSKQNTPKQNTYELDEAQIEIRVNEKGKIIFSKSDIEAVIEKNGQLILSNNTADVLKTMGISIKTISVKNSKVEVVIIDKRSTSKYSATLTNGNSLPKYLILDSKTGKITGTLPKKIKEVNISLKATSKDGTIRVLNLEMRINKYE